MEVVNGCSFLSINASNGDYGIDPAPCFPTLTHGPPPVTGVER